MLPAPAAEVSSTAQWVRDAAAQNRRKQAAAGPDQLKASLLQRDAAAATRRQQQQRPLPPPPPPPATPAEKAKAAGNEAFAAGNFAEASKLSDSGVPYSLPAS